MTHPYEAITQAVTTIENRIERAEENIARISLQMEYDREDLAIWRKIQRQIAEANMAEMNKEDA